MVKPDNVYTFDLDGTILRVNSTFAFYRYGLKEGLFSWKSLIPCLYYGLLFKISSDIEALYQRTFRLLFQGCQKNFFLSAIDDFVQQFPDAFFNQDVVRHVRYAQEQGYRVIVLSASPDFIVKPLIGRLNITEFFASSFLFNDQDIFTGYTCISGLEKSHIVRNLKEENYYVKAFSDSIEDLPFLIAADHQAVVKPKMQLKKLAKKYSWQII